MARLAALRDVLAAEGLFAEERKKPIPFLPRRIGLVCGKNSDAKHDVIENARRRWPTAEFEVREVKVQGATAVREVSQAITELDAIDDVDVIVVARGGGSFEDLLPFSDESLIRTIADAATPIVVAIGHEEDRPLVDYVADYRASTPTDAARRIVPDVVEELAYLEATRVNALALVKTAIANRGREIATLRARPALANPSVLIEQRISETGAVRNTLLMRVSNRVQLASAELSGVRATLAALSPSGTLERGFAIIRNQQDQVLKNSSEVTVGDELEVRLASGKLRVQVTGIESDFQV